MEAHRLVHLVTVHVICRPFVSKRRPRRFKRQDGVAAEQEVEGRISEPLDCGCAVGERQCWHVGIPIGLPRVDEHGKPHGNVSVESL